MILVTAFEPFGGRERNASAETLRLLPERIGGQEVRKMLLPVIFGKAAELVLQQEADAVFMLGEAGNRNAVTPELQAANLRDARIPDNAGCQPMGEKILPDGPAYYRTAVPVRQITAQMREEGYSVEVSEDAGTFVCNETFYLVGTALRVLAEFIHCPGDEGRAPEFAETVRRFICLAIR